MTLKDLQKGIGAWHRSTFGEEKSVKLMGAIFTKLEEEIEEFGYAEMGSEEEAQELADIIIVCLGYGDRMGYDMEQQVQAKLEILKQRDQLQRDRDKGYDL
jgi:hypothetical protein